ncbi:hypothetical protein IG193_04170 [Infirmifilum lucidum]|uniref:Uncharacterized protein n=1 Tax=Infirmifilum lucidum TaxID=2776706 RepID=A0A7L9FIV8_9CREN|nr:hypothetical protein [Infirmifilum lucidum]QOJ79657.1 hypothetical protein IG193_04170 [Infirmifilum lucidum]
MWPRVIFKNFSLASAAIAYWVRRFSPRVRVVSMEPLHAVYSVRGFRRALREGAKPAFSAGYLSRVLMVEHDPTPTPGRDDIIVSIEEPRLMNSPLTSQSGIEGLRAFLDGEVVLPGCLLGIQLALYLRENGINAFVSRSTGEKSWMHDILDPAIFSERAPHPELTDICREACLSIETREGILKIALHPFTDEVIHYYASLLGLALSSSSGVENLVRASLSQENVILIEYGDKVLLELGKHTHEASVKTTVHNGTWLRLYINKRARRVTGVSGVLHRSKLSLAVLPLLDTSNLCSINNLQLLATSKSPLFSEDTYLELLLAAWLRTC